MSTLTATATPFPGLRPFKPCEDHLFFGREQQVYTMVDRLEATRFLTVLGVSGSGKSSLVNCGLRPALHRGYMSSAGTRWKVATCRPGSDPIGNFMRALEEDISLVLDGAVLRDKSVDENGRKAGGFFKALADADAAPGLDDENILLVVDQFEELFRYMEQGVVQRQETNDFLQLLLEVRRQRTYPVYFAMSMRSDFLGECARFDGLPQAINEGLFLIPRLNPAERRSAIRGPIKVVAPEAEISEDLLDLLAHELGENPDQLTILQHALNRTWHYWNEDGGQGPISISHYQKAGKMDAAIDLHAELVFADLNTERQRIICETVFKALTERGEDNRGIRRPSPFDNLCALCDAAVHSRLPERAPITGEEVKAVIYRFWKPGVNFLFSGNDRLDDCDDENEPDLELDPDTYVDISHENLMEQWNRLKQWIEDETESAGIYRRLAKRAREYEAQKAALYTDPDLHIALEWRRKQQPDAAWAKRYDKDFDRAMKFLRESEEKRKAEIMEAEIQRLWLASRWRYLPLVVGIIVFVVFHRSFQLDVVVLLGRLGNWLNTISFLNNFFSTLDDVLFYLEDPLSNLLVGVPAALAYLLLTPFTRKRFEERTLVLLSQQDEEKDNPDEEDETVQAVEIHEAAYAKFGRRTAAHLIDWVICIIFFLLWVGLVVIEVEKRVNLNDISSAAFGYGGAALIFWLYRALWLSSKLRATPGMKLVGIFATDLQGRRLSFWRATGRHFASILSFYAVLVGYLMQPFNERRQTLHDRMSGTVILRRSKGTHDSTTTESAELQSTEAL